MAGLRRRLFCPRFDGGIRHRLSRLPPVRHLEALADLGGGKIARRLGRDGGRHAGGSGRRHHRCRRAIFTGDLMLPEALLTEARDFLARAREKRLRIVTAESCTGGLVAGLLTEIPGSSDVVERGFVTYSNAAKEELLGVPRALLEA